MAYWVTACTSTGATDTVANHLIQPIVKLVNEPKA